MNFKQTTPRSDKYLRFIRTQPCCQCGRVSGIHAHHTTTGGMGLKGSDYDTIPLCFQCHNTIHESRKDSFSNVKQVITRLRGQYKGETA